MMIVPPDMPWWRAVLHLRCRALDKFWSRLLFAAAMATGFTVVWEFGYLRQTGLTTTPFTLIGLALSIFLGFRNNASYERFWEGRKLWGRLVNTSRSLTRQLLTLPVAGDGEDDELRAFQQETVRALAAYVHALRLRLRGEGDLSELARLLPHVDLAALAASSNPPVALLQRLGGRFREAWQRGWVDTLHLPVLEDSLTQLTDIQGGCERIKSTPIPLSYSLLTHRIVVIYCLTLPFGLFDTVGTVTPLVVLLVGYAFYGLDAIGDAIEEPFGHEDHDLPLTALSTMIEVNVREQLGDGDLPALVTPDANYVLM